MAVQPALLPSLSALLPSTSYQQFTSRLSLQSIHIEHYNVRDDIYVSAVSAIPGQSRSLRLRAERISQQQLSKGSEKGKEKATGGDGASGNWAYSLVFLSAALSAREYSEMNVKACVAVDIAGFSGRGEIEGFIQSLGFNHSHSYYRRGHLFHLPVPIQTLTPLTLNITITRIQPITNTRDGAKLEPPDPRTTTEPYLLQILPSRPVAAISQRGEPGLQDTMGMIRSAADKLEGIQWETGR